MKVCLSNDLFDFGRCNKVDLNNLKELFFFSIDSLMFSVYGSLWSSYCTFLRKLKKISIIIKYLRKMLILHDDQSSAIIQPRTRLRTGGNIKRKKGGEKVKKRQAPFPLPIPPLRFLLLFYPVFCHFPHYRAWSKVTVITMKDTDQKYTIQNPFRKEDCLEYSFRRWEL